MVENTWLTPSVIVPAISILIASVIVPLLLHWLRGEREQKARIFEVRKQVYTQYLKKYEEAAAGVGHDYEHFSKVTLKDAFRELLEAGDSPDAILAFQSVVGDFPDKIQSAHRKATEETTTIKLLGSPELLELTREFEALHQQILNTTGPWLRDLQRTLTAPDLESPIAIELKKMGKRAQGLKEKIIEQMRRELKL